MFSIEKKDEIQDLVHGNQFLKFAKSSPVGSISCSKVNNSRAKTNCIDMADMSQTYLNLNRLIKNTHPFVKDIQFQVLANGNYAVAYKNIGNFYDLAFLSPELGLLKCVELKNSASTLVMKNYKNKLLLITNHKEKEGFGYEKYVRSDLMVFDDFYELTKVSISTKNIFSDNKQNYFSAVTANENCIFCFMPNKYIYMYDWALHSNSITYHSNFILNYYTFKIPVEYSQLNSFRINQLELLDDLLIFNAQNKLLIFKDNGLLVKEIDFNEEYFNCEINHALKQIVRIDRSKNELTIYDSGGILQNKIELKNVPSSSLNKFYFDHLGNILIVDLNLSLICKMP